MTLPTQPNSDLHAQLQNVRTHRLPRRCYLRQTRHGRQLCLALLLRLVGVRSIVHHSDQVARHLHWLVLFAVGYNVAATHFLPLTLSLSNSV